MLGGHTQPCGMSPWQGTGRPHTHTHRASTNITWLWQDCLLYCAPMIISARLSAGLSAMQEVFYRELHSSSLPLLSLPAPSGQSLNQSLLESPFTKPCEILRVCPFRPEFANSSLHSPRWQIQEAELKALLLCDRAHSQAPGQPGFGSNWIHSKR